METIYSNVCELIGNTPLIRLNRFAADVDAEVVVKVKSQDAIAAAKALIRQEGLMVGISAGTNAFAAREVARRPENKGKRVVTVMCDTSERYLSTALYEEG